MTDHLDQRNDDDGGVAVATRPAPPKLDRLPPWRVLLHNDDDTEMAYVVDTILELTSLQRIEATVTMLEAHQDGVALLLVTHQEHAELLEDQFQSKRLLVTIEPEE